MPSTVCDDGLKNTWSTSVVAKSPSIVTFTSSRSIASGNRGVPVLPGARAPTVPTPYGAGSAARSVVARPPVQSSHATTGAAVAFISAPLPCSVSSSPAPARATFPARTSPERT